MQKQPKSLEQICLTYLDQHSLDIIEHLTQGIYTNKQKTFTKSQRSNKSLHDKWKAQHLSYTAKLTFTTKRLKKLVHNSNNINNNKLSKTLEINKDIFSKFEQIRKKFALTGKNMITLSVDDLPNSAQNYVIHTLEKDGFIVTKEYKCSCEYDGEYWSLEICVSFE